MYNVWENVLAEIEQKISPANFSTWFQDTSLLSNEDGDITIGVKNSFYVKQLRAKYLTIITDALTKNGITVKNINFEVKSNIKLKIRPREISTGLNQKPSNIKTIKKSSTENNNGLNEKYTLLPPRKASSRLPAPAAIPSSSTVVLALVKPISSKPSAMNF